MYSKHLPPDVKDIPILPIGKNILKKDAYLRKNEIWKRYQSAEHYIDVQYHLMREELIRPLREDIEKYLKEQETGTPLQFGPTVFQNITIFSPTFFHEDLVWCVRFPVNLSSEEETILNTGHLKDGMLACLSSDNFQNEFLLAVILEKKSVNIDVHFAVRFLEPNGKQKNIQNVVINPDKKYKLVQSSSFFESCFHTLEALQEMKEIPLQKYIVKCDKKIKFPPYWRNYNLDFSPLLNGTQSIHADVRYIEKWPELLGLHEAQLTALQGALTNKLALIQGPPGTGKTYLGCKLMKLLLHNAEKMLIPVPILVVCYTNHAVDQFLEGICKFDRNIVRVGGGCKSKKLENLTLNQLRQGKRKWQTKEIIKAHYELKDPIADKTTTLENRDSKIILPDKLSEVIPKEIMKQFSYPFGKNKDIFSWLGINDLSAQIMETCSYIVDETLIKWCAPLLKDYEATEIISAIKCTGKMDMEIILKHLKTNSSSNSKDNHFIEDVVGEFLTNEQPTVLNTELKCAAYVTDANLIKNKQDRVETMFSWVKARKDEYKGKKFRNKVTISTRPGEEEIHEIVKKEKMRYFQNQKESIVPTGKNTIMTDLEEEKIKSIYSISMKNRWRLYRLWKQRIHPKLMEKIYEQELEYSESREEVIDIKDDEAKGILSKAKVIGMTTTGAVKNRHIINQLNIKIVIVEEAAEVLEAHIVTAIPKSTEHLILIGDHQQLKPKTNVYELARNYNLDISLFERLINNKLPFFQLSLQHRMRPEIADLLRLNIYKKLIDNNNVKDYEDVMGMKKTKKNGKLTNNNVFFIKHTKEESSDDGTSKTNAHEVEFLCALCRHLIRQGYKQYEITILSGYRGQVRLFDDVLPKYGLTNVKSTTIDNYQGEENEIILLSLVRSNAQGNIGFLKIINRVCVALSRAKQGFYCIGDFDKIKTNSNFWKNIVKHLETKNSIGESLFLHCVKHPKYNKLAKTAEDFLAFPEGGCDRNCQVSLKCGHKCPQKCHPNDKVHKNLKCKKLCKKKHPDCKHFIEVACCTDLTKKECAECLQNDQLTERLGKLEIGKKRSKKQSRNRKNNII